MHKSWSDLADTFSRIWEICFHSLFIIHSWVKKLFCSVIWCELLNIVNVLKGLRDLLSFCPQGYVEQILEQHPCTPWKNKTNKQKKQQQTKNRKNPTNQPTSQPINQPTNSPPPPPPPTTTTTTATTTKSATVSLTYYRNMGVPVVNGKLRA